MTSTSDLARSISARISNLALKLKVPYALVLTEFLLERLAVRLTAVEGLGRSLVFKGGYVALRVYGSPRFTVDLDVLLKAGDLKATANFAREAAEADLGDGVWFRLEKTQDLLTQGETLGSRLVMRAGLGPVLKKIQKAQLVHLDIGVGDPVRPDRIETPFLLGGGKVSWEVYPVEFTVAEKLHALVRRGSANSRAKDIFDLSFLLAKCRPKQLKEALTATFKGRGDEVPANFGEVMAGIDRSLLKSGWASAVEHLGGRMDFDAVFDRLMVDLGRVLG
jgi:predicted nucleotidyltransferase component of viral defense system